MASTLALLSPLGHQHPTSGPPRNYPYTPLDPTPSVEHILTNIIEYIQINEIQPLALGRIVPSICGAGCIIYPRVLCPGSSGGAKGRIDGGMGVLSAFAVGERLHRCEAPVAESVVSEEELRCGVLSE